MFVYTDVVVSCIDEGQRRVQSFKLVV